MSTWVAVRLVATPFGGSGDDGRRARPSGAERTSLDRSNRSLSPQQARANRGRSANARGRCRRTALRARTPIANCTIQWPRGSRHERRIRRDCRRGHGGLATRGRTPSGHPIRIPEGSRGEPLRASVTKGASMTALAIPSAQPRPRRRSSPASTLPASAGSSPAPRQGSGSRRPGRLRSRVRRPAPPLGPRQPRFAPPTPWLVPNSGN